MRKLYNEFFYIPKYGKVREKVMLIRIVSTVTVVIMCLVAMGVTAFAYFSCNVTSGANTIKAASFDAKITVVAMDQNGQTVIPSSIDGKKTVFTFESPGTYTVNIEKEPGSTAETGFCIIYVGKQAYHTQQIGIDIHANNEEREIVAFDLKINEPNSVVVMESHWGTSSYYDFSIDEENAFYIMNDPRRVIEVGSAPSSSASDADGGKETVSSTETTVPTEPTVTEPMETEPAETEPAVTDPTNPTEIQPTEETTSEPTVETNE